MSTKKNIEHKKTIARLNKAWKGIKELSKLGAEYGIDDIFQDNGAKVLQQLIYMKMKGLNSREGNDAIDENGVEWELKSCNQLKVSGVSTHHHLNHVILNKYRKVPWLFSVYEGIDLIEIYSLTSNQLEPIFKAWEEQLKLKSSLNNPKIPLTFIRKNGKKVYSKKK